MATIPTYGDPNVTDTPYHIGDESLIMFTGSPAIWLVDNKSKTFRAFSSDIAFDKAYANYDPEIIRKNYVKEVDPSQRAPGGAFDQNVYHVLDPKYTIKEDGKVIPVEFNPGHISSIYGQEMDTSKLQKSSLAVDGLFDMIKKVNTGVSPSFLDTLTKDKDAMAFYIGAATYGGYSVPDILMDIKKRELVSQGRTDMASISPISGTIKKSEYQNTDDYRKAVTTTSITPPPMIGKLNVGLLDLPIFSLPDEAFKALVPTLDENSAEFKQRFDKVVDAYHDIVAQQLSANTESEKAVADHNWEVFKSTAARDLGIKLSGNAVDAWKQIEDAQNAFSQRGIQGSGIQNEAIDDYLKGVRKNDQITRQSNLDATQQKEMEYYTKFATPDQVKQLIATDPEKAKNFGLTPSDEIKNSMSFAALKAKYPDLSDDKINRYISTVLDEGGNYRSGLYEKYALSKIDNSDAAYLDKRNQVFTGVSEEERIKREQLGKNEAGINAPTGTKTGGSDTFSNPATSEAVNSALGKKDQIQALTEANQAKSGTTGGKYDPLRPGETTDAYLQRIGVSQPKPIIQSTPSTPAKDLSIKLASGAPKIPAPINPVKPITPLIPKTPAPGRGLTITLDPNRKPEKPQEPEKPQVSPYDPSVYQPAATAPVIKPKQSFWDSTKSMFGF